MSEAVLKQVMQPLYRADQSRQRKTGGYGLGLYLAQQIAGAHQGSLSIESIPGCGCKVILILPNQPKNK